jgi:hypothetical protein
MQTTIVLLVRKWVRYLVGVACDQLALATRGMPADNHRRRSGERFRAM